MSKTKCLAVLHFPKHYQTSELSKTLENGNSGKAVSEFKFVSMLKIKIIFKCHLKDFQI